MKVDIEKIDALKRKLIIEIDSSEYSGQREKMYKEMGKNLKVPGFRKGNVPLDLLEKHHGKLLKEKFLEWAIPYYYEQALKDNNLTPVSMPGITEVKASAKKLTFNAEVELKPEISPDEKAYKGIKIKDSKLEVKDSEWKKLWDSLKENTQKAYGQDLDDEQIARWAGYASVEDLHQAALIELKSVKARQRRQEIENQVVQHLLKKIKVEVPVKVAEEHTRKLVGQEMYNLRAKGVSDEDLKKNLKDLEEKCRPAAVDQVKLYYILEAIAARENLKFDSQNIFERVMGYLLHLAEYK